MIDTPTRPFHAVVDLLERVAAGPMGAAPISERVALLTLEAARERGQDVTMGGLCVRIGISRGGITAIVDRLEADGYVSRLTRMEDRRATHLVITTAGSQLVADAIAFQIGVAA